MHETDHTASQGALAYDQAHGPVLTVNTESKTIAVFRIHGDRLTLSQILPSGGDFPVSVGVHGDHAYVLNALGGGPLYGYRVVDRRLTPIPCAHRALSLETTATTSFTATPGQVTFTPQGSQVPATAKGEMSTVDVFRVQRQLVRRADGPWERCDRRGDSGHSLGC